MRKVASVQKFTATVDRVDINPYVQVPDLVVSKLLQDAGREKGPIPVAGKLQGKSFSTTVVKFRGMWRLYLNTAMRREAGVDVGDTVAVEVWLDDALRLEPVPDKLALAFSKDRQALEAFEKLAPSRQKEILRYLASLKQEETLERNIEKIIQLLRDNKVG